MNNVSIWVAVATITSLAAYLLTGLDVRRLDASAAVPAREAPGDLVLPGHMDEVLVVATRLP